MKPISSVHGTRLTDDALLEEALAPLLDRALRTQCWFFFLDDEDRLTGPVIPCDELPAHPEHPCPTEDLGTVPWAQLIGARFSEIMTTFDFAQIVVVWERVGSEVITASDRQWARSYAAAFRSNGARVRAQLLLHSDGLRLIALDDLL